MRQTTRYNVGKFLMAGAILAGFLLVEVGKEGKATVLSGHGQQKNTLSRMYDRTPLVASSTPISSVKIAEFMMPSTGQPSQRFAEPVKKHKGLEAIAHKKKLGLTLFFIGMVADNN